MGSASLVSKDPDVSMIVRHKQWMTIYGRQYKDMEEKEKRYNIFKANVEYIDFVNSAGIKPYKLGVNEFADLTNDEFNAAYAGYRSPSKTTTSNTITSFRYENVTSIPPSMDWRKKGAVTPIRDAACGKFQVILPLFDDCSFPIFPSYSL